MGNLCTRFAGIGGKASAASPQLWAINVTQDLKNNNIVKYEYIFTGSSGCVYLNNS